MGTTVMTARTPMGTGPAEGWSKVRKSSVDRDTIKFPSDKSCLQLLRQTRTAGFNFIIYQVATNACQMVNCRVLKIVVLGGVYFFINLAQTLLLLLTGKQQV